MLVARYSFRINKGAAATGCAGESLLSKTNRSFGVFLAAISTILGGAGYWKGSASYPVWIMAALALAIVSCAMPRLFAPLRRSWMRLGTLLSHFMNPLILGITYAIVIVPVGGLIKLFRKDPLALNAKSNESSYWIRRDNGALDADQMKEQF